MGLGGIHIDIGGEGRYAAAWNVNPTTSAVPSHVRALGEQLPIRDASVDLVTLENAPVRASTPSEIARVLAPGAEVRLLHPLDPGVGMHDAVAGALGDRLLSRTSTVRIEAGVQMLTSVLRVR